MKKGIRILFLLVSLAILLLAAAAMADEPEAAPGSEQDPLVTLGYLNTVFTQSIRSLLGKELEEQVDALQAELEPRVTALEEGSRAAEQRQTYELLTLSDGQALICQRGTELLLRVGEAAVVAEDTPGLVDLSSTENLEAGKMLVKNHLYMVTINGHGLRAVGTTKLLARGEYKIG